MHLLGPILDFFLHFDTHLEQAIHQYGLLTYVFLFIIVFCETGLVVTPFLPGDSLLFAAGALAAKGLLHPVFLPAMLAAAATLGDITNYWIGRTFGLRGFKENARFLNTRHVDRTHAFYAKHGAKTLVMARFLPIVRTFAPFVAGLGGMPFTRFLAFSILGGILWVGSCFAAGVLFGNIPVVKDNFSLVVLGIIAVSLLPTVIALLRARFRK
ncbi:MAG TPA: VTT domain-containing protein [Fibrobacteria bacterium]|jgi:membrane-associated protein|nr:VTT domain-containing protein [Fibrobacteria bacterium]